MGWQEGNLERGASIQRNLAGLQNIAKMQIDTALARREQELERQKLELEKRKARSDTLLDWMSLANQAYQAGEDRKNRVETATAPIRETDRLSKEMYGWTPESGTSFAEWKARKDREAELGLYDEQLRRQLEYIDLLRKRGFDSGAVDGISFGTHNPYTDGGLSRTFLEDLNWGLKTDTEEVFARIGIESGLDRLFVQTEEAGQYPGGTMWFRSESAIDPKRALEWLRDNDPNNPTWKEIKDPNELTEKQYRNSINAVMRDRYIDDFLANFELDLQQLRMINPGRVNSVMQMLEETFKRRFPGEKYVPDQTGDEAQPGAAGEDQTSGVFDKIGNAIKKYFAGPEELRQNPSEPIPNVLGDIGANTLRHQPGAQRVHPQPTDRWQNALRSLQQNIPSLLARENRDIAWGGNFLRMNKTNAEDWEKFTELLGMIQRIPEGTRIADPLEADVLAAALEDIMTENPNGFLLNHSDLNLYHKKIKNLLERLGL